jgi:hypothetical protein
MRISIPFIALFATLSIGGCSKSNKNALHGNAALLAGKAWKLQRSDTIHLDSSQHIISVETTLVTDCQSRLNIIFYPQFDLQSYLGCSQPSNSPSTDWTWALVGDSANLLVQTLSGSPRSGPVSVTTDSVLTLTPDSLILLDLPSAWDVPYPFYPGVYHLTRVRNYFTHL